MFDIPAYQYKLKVVCIDDNESYLNSLSSELSKKFIVETFNDPIVALKYLKNSLNDSPEFLKKVPDLESHRVLIDLDIEQISKLSSLPKKDIGVVIVDHHMPTISGIELCKQLPNDFCKILLTGFADSNEAVNCFNNNIIDYYYLKDAPEIINELSEVIETASHQYFMKKSQHIYQALDKHQFSLRSQKVRQFILKAIKENSDNEFYLIDKNGSFMLVDESVKNYIIIHNDNFINEFIEDYQEVISIATVIEQIKKREAMPAFINVLPEQVPFDEWCNYIIPCQIIEDNGNYYAGVIYD